MKKQIARFIIISSLMIGCNDDETGCRDGELNVDIANSNWITLCQTFPDIQPCGIIEDSTHYNTYIKALKINADSNSLMYYSFGVCPDSTGPLVGFFWKEYVTGQMLFTESDYVGMYSASMETTVLFRYSIECSTMRVFLDDTSSNALAAAPFEMYLKYVDEIPENRPDLVVCK